MIGFCWFVATMLRLRFMVDIYVVVVGYNQLMLQLRG